MQELNKLFIELNDLNTTPCHFYGEEYTKGEFESYFGDIISDFNFYFSNNLSENDSIIQEMKDNISNDSIKLLSFSFFQYQENQRYLTFCFENNCYILQFQESMNLNGNDREQLTANFTINEIIKSLLNSKIHMISSEIDDYQSMESLLKELVPSEILSNNNIKLNKKYFQQIRESVEKLNKIKNIFLVFPVFKISCRSLLTYIIGRFYFKSKYFKNPAFFDVQSDYHCFKEKDFIMLQDSTSCSQLVLRTQTKQLFVKKRTLDNSILREESIYKLLKDSKKIIKCAGVIRKKDQKTESLIIEYMSNETLSKYVAVLFAKEKKSGNHEKYQKKRVFLILDIIEQLYLLHSKKILHRDLKPNNILIDHDFNAHIADFNCSLEYEENHEMTGDIGSKSYSAPEVLYKADFTYQSDVYSLGCIIYFICTGKHYYTQKLDTDFGQNIKKDIKDEDLRNLVLNCVNNDPTLRPKLDEILRILDKIAPKHGIVQTNKSISNEKSTLIDIHQNNSNADKIDLRKKIQDCFEIGLKYYFGKGCQKDIKKAIHYFTISAENGSQDAQLILSDIYIKGAYSECNIEKAIYFLTMSANSNNIKAFFRLGLIYSQRQFNSLNPNKALYYLNLASQYNHPDALLLLGDIYIEGKIIRRDINKAIDYYRLASNLNNPHAQYELGKLYYEGRYVSKDIKKAIIFFQLASKQCVPEALYSLGAIYYYESPKDINQAIFYLKQAADLNHIRSQAFLGYIYVNNQFFQLDIDKSIHYLSLAANQNDSESQYQLGKIYYEGKYTMCDIKKAIKYFTLASNQNHSQALYGLSKIYYEGIYIEQNIPLALYYLRKSASLGDMKAQCTIGSLYYEENSSIDINEAISNFQKAEKQGNVSAMYLLGTLYYESNFNLEDKKKSIYYLNKAANYGHLHSKFLLALIYYEGIYDTRDVLKAINYLIPLAEIGELEAPTLLGYIYLDKRTKYYDTKKAIHFLTLGANQNDRRALCKLGSIYYYGEHVQRDINKSINYLRQASNLNYTDAQYLLGKIYYDGKYIQRDINKSIYYLQLAANKNDCGALYELGIIFYYKDYHHEIEDHNYYNTSDYIKKIRKRKKINMSNFKQAFFYWQMAAKYGSRPAQCALGSIYYEGKYIQRDIEKAIYYFKESSNMNIPLAKNNLGVIYKNGDGVDQNIPLAIEYFKKGIMLNDLYSIYNYSRILYFDEKNRNIKESIDLLEQIKSDSELIIPLFLFFIYKRGYEIIRNDEKASSIEQLIIYNHPNDNLSLIFNSTTFQFEPLDFFKSYDLIYTHDDLDCNNHFVYYLITGKVISELNANDFDDEDISDSHRKNINHLFYEGFSSPDSLDA